MVGGHSLLHAAPNSFGTMWYGNFGKYYCHITPNSSVADSIDCLSGISDPWYRPVEAEDLFEPYADLDHDVIESAGHRPPGQGNMSNLNTATNQSLANLVGA